MRRSTKHVSLGAAVLALLLFTLPSFGQETWEKENEGEIKDLEIEMTKERQVILPRANRYFEKVPPRPFAPIVPAITYEVRPLAFSSPNYASSIRPLRIKQEELSKLYSNYMSAGVGNYTSFLLEGSIATKRDRNKLLGADFAWRGFGKGPVDEDHSASSRTRFGLYGKTLVDQVRVSGSLNYRNERGYFYGYVPGTVANRDNLKQVYEDFSAHVAMENNTRQSFNYQFNAGYGYLRDSYAATEGEAILGFKGDYELKTGRRLVVNADLFAINWKDVQNAQDRLLMHIQPAYTFTPSGKIDMVIGANVAISNDTYAGAGSSVKIFPNVKGTYRASEKLNLYAQLSGDLDKVNLHSLSSENFWINSGNAITHTQRALELDGGVKAIIGSKLTGKVGASYASLKNLYYYEAKRDTLDLAKNDVGVAFDKFNLVYDNTTGRFHPYGEFTFTASDIWSASLRGDLFQYTTDVQAEPWHRPTYQADLRINANLYEKIYIQAGLMMQGGMKARDPISGNVITLSAATDLNVRVRYFFSRQLSAFLQLENILSNTYPLYPSYPARGFQGMAGVSWSF
jgi:hypothetical protein